MNECFSHLPPRPTVTPPSRKRGIHADSWLKSVYLESKTVFPTDPLILEVTDSTISKFQRRHPYMPSEELAEERGIREIQRISYLLNSHIRPL